MKRISFYIKGGNPSLLNSHAEVNISDFPLYDYPVFGQIGKVHERPLRVITDIPPLVRFEEVTYVPATKRSKPFDGCLYDNDRNRIEASCVLRGTDDRCWTIGNDRWDGDSLDLPILEQPVIYLGFINPHYGHFLLESLSYWWVLLESAGDVDNYLIHVHDPNVFNLPYVQACLEAMPIDRDKIVYFDQPMRCREVFVAHPAFQYDSHVYVRYRELCNLIAAKYARHLPSQTDQPLYVSRQLLTSGVRGYRDEIKIEEYFAERGAKIIHPQMLPFEEQVSLFNYHSRIAGISGSGMHNIIFSTENTTAIYLTPHWIIPSLLLIDKCFEIDSVYIHACKTFDRLRIPSERIATKFLGKATNCGSFGTLYNLDYGRVIRRLEDSKLLE